MKFNGRNVFVDGSAKIGERVRIGDNCKIYANVEIGDDVTIANDSVIGEPLSNYYIDENYSQPPTTIGSDALIRSHAIIYAGVEIGIGFSCGHRVIIRENVSFGEHCRVGTSCDLQSDVTIGNHVWMHSNVFISGPTRIDDYVLIYPHVVVTNDTYPPSEQLQGVHIKNFAQIGAQTTLMPGVVLNEHCLIGSGSVITRDVEGYSLTIGNPGRHVKDVRDIRLEDGSQAYPWPNRFERGMPWQGHGFDQWRKVNNF